MALQWLFSSPANLFSMLFFISQCWTFELRTKKFFSVLIEDEAFQPLVHSKLPFAVFKMNELDQEIEWHLH